MFKLLKSIFGTGQKVDYIDLLKQGAVIIDVRTKGEYKEGHIKGSLNIPLHELAHQMKMFDKDRPVLTCCASGMRSSSAKNMLKTAGFLEVHNGGGWMSLQNKIQEK